MLLQYCYNAVTQETVTDLEAAVLAAETLSVSHQQESRRLHDLHLVII
jgi:hypothetical protein